MNPGDKMSVSFHKAKAEPGAPSFVQNAQAAGVIPSTQNGGVVPSTGANALAIPHMAGAAPVAPHVPQMDPVRAMLIARMRARLGR
jgi:hypothetical protein